MKKGIGTIGLVLIIVGALVLGAVLALIIRAQTQPTIVKEAQVTFEILEAPDFTLEVSAGTTAIAGQVFPLGITITPNSSFAGQVELSVSGLPAGVTATFFPASTVTVGGGPAGAQIDLAIPRDNALVGSHTITVTALSRVYNGNN